ncbi:DNAJC7 [Lepeophtheirus salmonis]|uniref:DNAJC7 n=1 Tax=Lepeophtheirus salmonis TaxID=72036 RepID=A0A7R8CPZ3_LEPSM|nr:DNAJC7 [Lepeophtheirus salmonis]CAF2890495.1 DNAJC7 [Lepeophtheirus salmonis]
MSFEGLFSDNRGCGSELLSNNDEIFSSYGLRRSRERTKTSAVQRLVERRQAQQQRTRSNSNNSNNKKQEIRSSYHRSLSANNNVNKTYITIGPGKPTRIRESSPIKKKHPHQKPTKLMFVVLNRIRSYLLDLQKQLPNGEFLFKKGLLLEPIVKYVKRHLPFLREKPKKLDIRKKNEMNNSKLIQLFFNSQLGSRKKTSSANRRLSQGNLIKNSEFADKSFDKKPPLAHPRKISLQNCHYPITKAKDLIRGNSMISEGYDGRKTKEEEDALYTEFTPEIDQILCNIRKRQPIRRTPIPKCKAPPLPDDSIDDDESIPLHLNDEILHSSSNRSRINKGDNLNEDYERRNSEAHSMIKDLQEKLSHVNRQLDEVNIKEQENEESILNESSYDDDSGLRKGSFNDRHLNNVERVGTCCTLSSSPEKKEEGNALYKTKSYIDALSKYSEAIVLCPKNPAFYGNRSACHMMLGQYSNALEDAKRSVSINPEFIKGYIRVAKCCMMLGDIMSAKQAIQQVATLDPNNTSLLSEKQSLERLENFKSSANEAFCLGDYRKAVYLLNQCKSIATGANDIKLSLAECLANLGRLSEAKEIAYALLRANSMDADAIYVKAKEVFKRAKLLKQKKEDGNKAFKSTNAKLFFNRATVVCQSMLGKLEQSIEDCNSALELDESYLKALMRRAKSYMDLQDYENAVKDYETLARRDRHNSEYQQMMQMMTKLKRHIARGLLFIIQIVIPMHPENERVEHEKIFKEVGEAYGILSDRKKNALMLIEELEPDFFTPLRVGMGGDSVRNSSGGGGSISGSVPCDIFEAPLAAFCS